MVCQADNSCPSGDRMTPRYLWGIQLEISRRQFREEPELEKVSRSFSKLPWTCISESIQSWRNHQELSSMPRPCTAHNALSKPHGIVLLCRALLQGEHCEKQLLWRQIPAPN